MKEDSAESKCWEGSMLQRSWREAARDKQNGHRRNKFKKTSKLLDYLKEEKNVKIV